VIKEENEGKKIYKDENDKENDEMQRRVLTSEFASVYQSSFSFFFLFCV